MHYVPLTSIFSTRVISGAKSSSDLDTLLERRQVGSRDSLHWNDELEFVV